jgi:hypothetical protein
VENLSATTRAGSSSEEISHVLSAADLEAIFALHLAATAAVGRPDLIKPESRDFFGRILGGGGHVVGIRRDGQLIAYGVLQTDLAPSEDARPLLGLAAGDRLAKLAGASVLPRLWGGGLHADLIARRVAEAERLGIDHLYATSAPGNTRSWTNLVDRGFVVRALVEKYGGQLRYILYRHRTGSVAGGAESWCDAADTERQRLLIAQGFIGASWRQRDDGVREICYRGQR